MPANILQKRLPDKVYPGEWAKGFRIMLDTEAHLGSGTATGCDPGGPNTTGATASANSVHPGSTDTPMTCAHQDNPNIHKQRVAKMPLGHIAQPTDILYLASDESSFVAGAELVIDGSMTSQ